MKTSLILEIEIEVDYDFQPMERMTRHYPGCPEEVEINTLSISGIELPMELQNLIMRDFEYEIYEWVWDDVRDRAAEDAVCRAEHQMDIMRNR